MATDYKISELASATSLDGTEQLVIVKNGENKKLSLDTLKTKTVEGLATEEYVTSAINSAINDSWEGEY